MRIVTQHASHSKNVKGILDLLYLFPLTILIFIYQENVFLPLFSTASPRILQSSLLSLSAHTLHTPSILLEKAADTADSENDHQAEG